MCPGLDLYYASDPAQPLTMAREELLSIIYMICRQIDHGLSEVCNSAITGDHSK